MKCAGREREGWRVERVEGWRLGRLRFGEIKNPTSRIGGVFGNAVTERMLGRQGYMADV